jgi:DNA-directed RNA polymerase specialized sigma24 family protein
MPMSDQDPPPGRPLERFRAYLSLLAQAQLDPRPRGTLDVSGVVKQTLLEAYQALDQVGGWNETQQAAWLCRALAHNLTDEVRKLHRAGRDVRRGAVTAGGTGRRCGSTSAWSGSGRCRASAAGSSTCTPP